MKTPEVRNNIQSKGGAKLMNTNAHEHIVEVFRTNVEDEKDAGLIINRLQQKFPGSVVNLDLEDCDKVLRIVLQAEQLDVNQIIDEVNISGFFIEAL